MFKKIQLAVLLLVLVLLLPAAASAGGWATITLIHLPRAVQAGDPVDIEFVVRQHGHSDRLVSDLAATVTARSGKHTVTAAGMPTDEPGHYEATLILPHAGVWSWQIEAFSTQEMPPITVTDADRQGDGFFDRLFAALLNTRRAQAASSPAQYGHDLFIAKGCVTCHTHDAVPGYFTTNLGPNLSDYEPNAEYVDVWLRNAGELTKGKEWPMPTLELTGDEIDALIAFLAEE